LQLSNLKAIIKEGIKRKLKYKIYLMILRRNDEI